MNALRTARVVVIEDEPNEAMPVLHALGKLGIGCVHVAGDKVEDLPAQPLPGIRLVFLDMKLGTGGEARLTAPHTANVFTKVVGTGSGPVLVILWTQHPEEVAPFRQTLFQHVPEFREALLFATLDKIQWIQQQNAQWLLAEVQKLLEGFRPLDGVWLWEQLVHDATSATVAAVSAVASQRAGLGLADDDTVRCEKWLGALQHALGCLGRAAAGKAGASEPSFHDLVEVLNAIHEDRIEHEAVTVDLPAGLPAGTTQTPSGAERAAINAMLLTAPVRLDDIAVRPGNLYTRQPAERSSACAHVLCGANPEQVGREVLQLRGTDLDWGNGRSTNIWEFWQLPAGWPAKPPVLRWNTNNLMWGLKGMTAIS